VPTSDIIAQFKSNRDFILDDKKVILPLHEPDTADLTGEFLIYYPDHVVPCVVFYDFATDDLARIPIEEFHTKYPAWRLRFWHPSYEPGIEPSYLKATEPEPKAPPVEQPIETDTPLPNDGEELIDELRTLITEQEVAKRAEARNECQRLPSGQFLEGRAGIQEVVAAGRTENEFGEQVVRFLLPNDSDPNEVDIVESYGVHPGSEVIVDALDDLEGFPAEAEVVDIQGNQLELSFYWDRGPNNPDLSVFDLETENRFLLGELLNPVPFDRKREAVDLISSSDRKRGWLSGTTTIDFEGDINISLSKSRLNNSQYQAAYSALTATDVYCIHGPPGAGKTRTLVEIIKAACADRKRVLAVAHSNQAVDNLLVGDSTAESPDPNSIHGVIQQSELTAARAGGNTESDLVSTEYADEDLYKSDVVCATMSAAHQFGEDIFDLAVIDEATQASIAASMIPAARAKRLVLVGDHKQLPPYYAGENSEEEEMTESLFGLLLELYADDIVTTLRTQYRMNEEIAAFPNEEFYGGQLNHGQQNRQWSIGALPPLAGVQVAGAEETTPTNTYYDVVEADVVAEEVEKLIQVGVGPADIGIITPYSGQIGKIHAGLAKSNVRRTDPIKIATIDSFQGSEREAIIVSFVRSNPEGFSGFLTFPNEGPRRLNVALTRARKRCVLIGNFDTLRTVAPTKEPKKTSADTYHRLYESLETRGLLHDGREGT